MSHNPPPQKKMNFNPNDNSAPAARASNPPSASAAAAANNNNSDDSHLSLLTGDIPLDFDGFHNDALYMSNLLSAPAAAAGLTAAQNTSGGNKATKTSPSTYQSYATNNISSEKIAGSAVAASAGPSSSADTINNAEPDEPARRRSSVVSVDSRDERDFISAVQSTANDNNSSIGAPNASISATMMAHRQQHMYQQSYRLDDVDNNQQPQPQPQPSHQQQTFVNNQFSQFLQAAPKCYRQRDDECSHGPAFHGEHSVPLHIHYFYHYQ